MDNVKRFVTFFSHDVSPCEQDAFMGYHEAMKIFTVTAYHTETFTVEAENDDKALEIADDNIGRLQEDHEWECTEIVVDISLADCDVETSEGTPLPGTLIASAPFS